MIRLPLSDRGRRQGAGLLAFALLVLAGCTTQPEVPPYLERQYMALSIDGQWGDIDFQNDDGSGPYIGGEVTLGFPIEQEGTYETSLEGAWSYSDLGTGADFDGNTKRGRLGMRRTFDLDQRLRPGWLIGATYQWWNFSRGVADDDFRGPGVYAGGFLDYMLAPRLAVGTELRWHLHWWNAHKNNSFATTVDLGIRFTYRF